MDVIKKPRIFNRGVKVKILNLFCISCVLNLIFNQNLIQYF